MSERESESVRECVRIALVVSEVMGVVISNLVIVVSVFLVYLF